MPVSALSQEVIQFLSQDPIPMQVGGRDILSQTGNAFEVRDPGNGRIIARVTEGEHADVHRAVSVAQDAFQKGPWPKFTIQERAVLLHRLADLIDKHRDILAQLESIDAGKPFAAAQSIDIPNVASTLRYFADLSVHVPRAVPIAVSHFEARSIRVPYGVCGFIFPWNFPLLLVGWGVAPALAAGNTVVIKPAEDTPLSTLYFCRLAREAGIPEGVVNVVTGLGETAGAALASHPGLKRMSFTGSPEVGRMVGELCGRNLTPVKLELGGKGAAVVFEDVDARVTGKTLAGAITFNTGQVCCTATRWFLHDKVFDEVVASATEALGATRIGYELDSEAQMGPLVSEKQRQRVLGYLDRGVREGASLLVPGGQADVPHHPSGFYVKPALLGGSPDNVCCREEIFGPVAYVVRFRDEDQAIELVNSSPYGLANSVWSRNLDRANRVAESLHAGNSWINAHNLFPHGVPYGGCNLSGCGGGVLSPETYLDYLRPQSIVRPLP